MYTGTITAKQIKERQANPNILSHSADITNKRSLTPNYRTSDTYEDSNVIAYKDPRKHIETIASMKDLGLLRNASREQNPTYKSKELVNQISHETDEHKYSKLKITQQDKPQPKDYEKQNIQILDAKKESAPDLLIDHHTRDEYYREKDEELTTQRLARSSYLSMKHAKLDYDWDYEHKKPVKVDRGLTFKPNFREVSPRENKRQALYSQETLERVPANSNKSPKKKEQYTESPEAKKKFVNQKRLVENSSSVFFPSGATRSQTPVVVGNKEKDIEFLPVDCKWNDRLADNKYKNFPNQFETRAPPNIAAQRRTKEHSSNIFHQADKENVARDSAVATNLSGPDFQDHENEYVRRREPNFSDLLNLENYQQLKRPRKNEASIPTTADFANSQYESFSPKPKNPDDHYDIKEKKLAERVAALDSETIKTNAELYKGKEAEAKPTSGALVTIGIEHKPGVYNARGEEYTHLQENPDHTKNMLKAFNLTAVPKSVDEKILKKLFAGFHLVDLECDVNKLTNKPTGGGQVKIRSDDPAALKKLQQKLKQVGIYMTPKEQHTGLRNNYTENPTLEWCDQNLEREEKRLTPEYVEPKVAKRKNLQSEGEVFGNRLGHGKWPTNWDADGAGNLMSNKDYISTAHWNQNMKRDQRVKSDVSQSYISGKRPKSNWINVSSDLLKVVKKEEKPRSMLLA